MFSSTLQKPFLQFHAATFYFYLVEPDHKDATPASATAHQKQSMISSDMLDSSFIENRIMKVKIKMSKLIRGSVTDFYWL